MLELLVTTICIFGNNTGCVKGLEAYYKQQKLDIIVDEIRDNNKEFDKPAGMLLSFFAIYREQKFILPIYEKNNKRIDYQQSMQGIVLNGRIDF